MDWFTSNIGPIGAAGTPARGGGRIDTDATQSIEPPIQLLSDPFTNECVTRQRQRQIQSDVEPVRVYGQTLGVDELESAIHTVDEDGPLRVEVYQGQIGETHQRISGRLTWNGHPEIPRDTCFVIHLFVDVSGSMDCSLQWNENGGGISRIKIIRKAIITMKESLKPLVEKGLRVKMSLHTFSDSCEERVKTVEMTKEYMETMDWNYYLQATNMTNIWDTVRVVKEMRVEEEASASVIDGVSEEHVYIIMSDGQQTVTADIPEDPVNVFDYAIGIGTSNEYDATILQKISCNPIESCPDDTTLSSTLLRLGCGSYMTLAKNVNVCIQHGAKRKELEMPIWMSGSSLIFSYRIPTQTTQPLSITYTMDSPIRAVSFNVHFDPSCRRRSRRTGRLITKAIELQEEAKEALKNMKDEFNIITIHSMVHKLEAMCQRFKKNTWIFGILDGMRHTWKTMEGRVHMPQLDRYCSVQSAIRQTSANCYDVQMASNINTYSQQAM